MRLSQRFEAFPEGTSRRRNRSTPCLSSPSARTERCSWSPSTSLSHCMTAALARAPFPISDSASRTIWCVAAVEWSVWWNRGSRPSWKSAACTPQVRTAGPGRRAEHRRAGRLGRPRRIGRLPVSARDVLGRGRRSQHLARIEYAEGTCDVSWWCPPGRSRWPAWAPSPVWRPERRERQNVTVMRTVSP